MLSFLRHPLLLKSFIVSMIWFLNSLVLYKKKNFCRHMKKVFFLYKKKILSFKKTILSTFFDVIAPGTSEDVT